MMDELICHRVVFIRLTLGVDKEKAEAAGSFRQLRLKLELKYR
jgi:hypothetical protein